MLAVIVALVGCTSDNSEPEGTRVTSSTASPTPDGAPPVVFGTWDKPLPAGTPLTLSAWEVTIDEVRVLAEATADPDYPPDPGNVHVVAHVEAVRIAPEPGAIPSMFDGGFRLSLMSDGVEVGNYVALPIEDEIHDGVVAPGGVVEGMMLVAADVPEDAVPGAVLMVYDHGSGAIAYVAWP